MQVESRNPNVNVYPEISSKPDIILRNLTDSEQKSEDTFKSHISNPAKVANDTLFTLGYGTGLTLAGVFGIVFTLPLSTPIAIIGAIGSASITLTGLTLMEGAGKELISSLSSKNTLPESLIIPQLTQISESALIEILVQPITLKEPSKQEEEEKALTLKNTEELKKDLQIITTSDELLKSLHELILFSNDELTQNEKIAKCLLVERKLPKKVTVDRFIQIFNEEIKTRLTNLKFKSINNKSFLNFTKIVYRYNQFPAGDDALIVAIFELKVITKAQCDFYQGLIDSFKHTYRVQTAQLHPSKLNLSAFIPSERYNYELDQYFSLFEKSFTNQFKEDPEQFPKNVLSAKDRMRVKVHNLTEFKKYQEEYEIVKTLQHGPIIKCLPKEYPINMPNFLNLTGLPTIKIKNHDEFKKMISAYTFYFDEILRIQTYLNKIVISKIALKNYLDYIAS